MRGGRGHAAVLVDHYFHSGEAIMSHDKEIVRFPESPIARRFKRKCTLWGCARRLTRES